MHVCITCKGWPDALLPFSGIICLMLNTELGQVIACQYNRCLEAPEGVHINVYTISFCNSEVGNEPCMPSHS